MNIELTEQEVAFLDDYLKQEIETEYLSETSRKIITNLIDKLNENN